MSELGDWPIMCSCSVHRCIKGNCSCFKAKLSCSVNCKCKGCRNTENNKAEAESLYQAYKKRNALLHDSNQSVPKFKLKNPVPESYPCVSKLKNPVPESYLSVPQPEPKDGLPVPPGFRGCKCQMTGCYTGKCACFRRSYKCTSKCKCQNCANPKGLRSDTNTEQGKGGVGGVSNIPGEAVQATPSRSNKRPRNM